MVQIECECYWIEIQQKRYRYADIFAKGLYHKRVMNNNNNKNWNPLACTLDARSHQQCVASEEKRMVCKNIERKCLVLIHKQKKNISKCENTNANVNTEHI